MSHNDVESSEAPTHDSADTALSAYEAAMTVEILSDLRAALATYPRAPAETLTAWFDRVIPEHVVAPEYSLAHALGIAEGADIDMLTDEFDAALQGPSGEAAPSTPDREDRPTTEVLATGSTDESGPRCLNVERNEACPWQRKPLGDFTVDSNSWASVRVRFNRDHYMSSSCFGVVSSSRVGDEIEAALSAGHTYDSIFQEGLTKIRQLDGNYVVVPIGDLIVWSEEDPDFWSVFLALEKKGYTRSEIFKAGLVALHGPVAPYQELLEIDASNLEEERPGVWTGILGEAPPVKPL